MVLRAVKRHFQVQDSPGVRDMIREIARLAVPAFGAPIAQPLFLLVDAGIVARIGVLPLGGLSVASSLLTTLASI